MVPAEVTKMEILQSYQGIGRIIQKFTVCNAVVYKYTALSKLVWVENLGWLKVN